MGVLARAEAKTFFLRARDCDAAADLLRAMAKDDPDEFLDAGAAAGAADFEALMFAAGWVVTHDDAGNVVSARFAADKAPREAADLWPVPMFLAMAAFVPAVIIDVRFDGAPSTYVLFGTQLQQWHGPPPDDDARRTRASIRKTAQRIVRTARASA